MSRTGQADRASTGWSTGRSTARGKHEDNTGALRPPAARVSVFFPEVAHVGAGCCGDRQTGLRDQGEAEPVDGVASCRQHGRELVVCQPSVGDWAGTVDRRTYLD